MLIIGYTCYLDVILEDSDKLLNNLSSYIEYVILHKKCKYLKFRDFIIYIYNTQSSVKNNPKYFWLFFKIEKLISQLSTSMSYLEKEVNNGKGVVNLFKLYFSNSYHLYRSMYLHKIF